jgi:hypothetical protein
VAPFVFVTTSFISSDAVGAIVSDPEVATDTPLRVAVAAFALVQLMTVVFPAVTVVGAAVTVAVRLLCLWLRYPGDCAVA